MFILHAGYQKVFSKKIYLSDTKCDVTNVKSDIFVKICKEVCVLNNCLKIFSVL